MSMETLSILEQLSRDKGIDKDILIDALKSAVEVAARKRYPAAKELQSEFNESTGEVEIYLEKAVVEDVDLPDEQISLKDALTFSEDVQLGDQVLVQQIMENYGRTAAQLAKQVIIQKLREAEIDLIYNEYIDRKGELINGMVHRMEHGDLVVDLGKAEGVLPRREQVFRESFNRGERIRAYILDVRKTPKHALVILSRTHVGLIKRLFEMEVPEISEGMVEIMGVVREPNGRTKIAVRTNDREIDAVGACVGMRGMRVQSIVQELRGEKIDIVEFSEDPETYIKNALSPAKVARVVLNPDEKQMTIIVAEDQMSLAIGKKGQNVRLAAKLVRWKVDIKGPSEALELGTEHAFLTPAETSEVDFLDDIKNAKGLGEKVMTLLFNENVVTYEEALSRGAKGLVQLPGIGPKKAEALMELAEAHVAKVATQEPTEEETSEASEPAEAAPEIVEGESETDEPVEEEDVAGEGEEDEEEEEEIPVQELKGVTPEVLETLISNGFETLAELSVTPLVELLAMEGIDEEVGQSILEQVKQRLENLENV
ncbi:MAG: transcription termination/antitermination protein NusA [Nitrospina sp.]|jgi:transcription termination/antitermination protein NusA|nr:transcription termination/antitermination protein NusA [Nitrospina sp.]MBT3415482.1 transcription termination/antitermination protein NusA [Nitrospina sp.]MBT3855869.1 transcription termination/antitermination protein NusA [Nitrospina sp.]MBT4105130.1 transcription termination/antitermination protein NusA [Nitrospina sp.]MBT4389255.1 transcription termination/antitermination protein NusA [Nitrospina sp.]